MKSLGFWVALIVTGCFVTLNSFAWGRVVTHWAPSSGYTASERAAHDQLLPEGAAREVVLFKNGFVLYDSKAKVSETLGLIFSAEPAHD